MQNWDYQLGKNWKPTTKEEWIWFLVRKINYNDLRGIKKEDIKHFFVKIKSQLDPGKRIMLEKFINAN